jgi:site-specific DNA-methyltransferase (adenine-specific)
MTNALFYGDNLDVLRNSIPDESVDLIYLDPPFNSNASYNVLFEAPSGKQSQAQIEAFEDTWHWAADNGAELAFDEVMHSGNAEAAKMLKAIRSFLGENDMMAYLTMMAVRLIELHRALKPTGSLYLHCDPVASHYLKILLDSRSDQFSQRDHLEANIRARERHQAARRRNRHDSLLRKGDEPEVEPAVQVPYPRRNRGQVSEPGRERPAMAVGDVAQSGRPAQFALRLPGEQRSDLSAASERMVVQP